MTCRDWPSTLQEAQYKGAKFFVERDSLKGGRALVVHEFPHGDLPYIEDQGASANRISVTAYVASDAADAEARSLVAACNSGGPGLLVLPIERFLAHCETWSRDFSKDQLGYIALSLDFVREGTGPGPFPLSFLARMVEVAAGSLVTTAAAAFASAFDALAAPGYVRAAAASDLRDIAITVEAALDVSPLTRDPTELPKARLAIRSLYGDAESLTAIGTRPAAFRATSYTAEEATGSAAPLVATMETLFDALALAGTPGEIRLIAEPWLTYESASTVLGPDTANRRQLEANRAALGGLMRHFAIATYVAAIVRETYTDRRTAIQARADTAELIETELMRLSGGRTQALGQAIDSLRVRATEHLTRVMADLAPIIIATSDRQMPALWWAQRLYGDATRADELAKRNIVKHPLFMPREIEALAR